MATSYGRDRQFCTLVLARIAAGMRDRGQVSRLTNAEPVDSPSTTPVHSAEAQRASAALRAAVGLPMSYRVER